ncbi:MAG: hypothetical protein E7505_07515 [Ruminococcus sp.]|nr:hypothetical protein [Ruminococcus sp.]
MTEEVIKVSNIIIMNLSSLSAKASEEIYESDLGQIKGKNTADAPVKYIIDYIKKKNEKVGKILTVVTEEAENSFSEFRKMLSAYAPEVPEPVCIPGSDEYKTVIDVLSHVKKGDKIYIEATGGLRNTTYTLMMIVRILEYSGVTLEKAVYSKHNNDRQNSKPNRIEDITDVYRTLNLINAANSFTSFGSSDELEKYFENNDDVIIKETINAMRNFSDDITLCRVSRLDKTLEALNTYLKTMSGTELKNKDSALFRSLAEVIREKFYMDKAVSVIEYPDIVRWCLDNKLIQQAVTIFTEKMPRYFFEKKFFTVAPEEFAEKKKKNEKSNFGLEYELFYSGLMTDSCIPEAARFFRNTVSRGAQGNEKSIISRGKTDENIIFEALGECNDITTFAARTRKLKSQNGYSTDEFARALKKYFKIKRIVYFPDGTIREHEAILEKLETENEPEVRSAVSERSVLPKKMTDFPKAVKNYPELFMAVFEFRTEYDDEHLNFIGTLEKRKVSQLYTITDKLSVEELKTLFMDIYYIKTFVRNKLNHASEDDSDEERKSFFSGYERYNTDSELTVTEITSLLSDTLDIIRRFSS